MGFASIWYSVPDICEALRLTDYFIAGGGSYYFAKRSIKADRNARHEADLKLRQTKEPIETDPRTQDTKENHRRNAKGKGDYEASVPYRSKKGDRFS